MNWDKKLILMMWVRWAGKNTQISELLRRYSEYFGQALSCKTREFRDGESEWVDYYKVDLDVFDSQFVNDMFLETNRHFGNCYGTRYKDVNNVIGSWKHCLKELEPEWFAKVFKKKEVLSYALFWIFMDIPNVQIRSRMKSRWDADNEIQKALGRADFERQLAFLYSSVYGDTLLRFVDASKRKEEVFNELLCILWLKSSLILSAEDMYEKNSNVKIIREYR